MEILRFLLNFFLEEYGGKEFAPIIEKLNSGTLDIKSILSEIKPETVAPILKKFFSSDQKDSPAENGEACGLEPIKDFADEEVIRSLNNFFEN